MNPTIKNLIQTEAKKYLIENPERFDESEKTKFLDDLNIYLTQKDIAIADEVYDFLVYKSLIKSTNRTNQFARYINSKYSPSSHPNILDIGAGRMCKLSNRLARSGYNITAIDPKIRISNEEAKNLKISQISKELFQCDDFSQNTGTNIQNFDLLIGLEPCDATEHIIRQGLKYDKPFEILLCYSAHKALNGKKFKTPEEWYNHLKSISSEVNISKVEDSFIATNN